jgi:hypothetical protein
MVLRIDQSTGIRTGNPAYISVEGVEAAEQ